jgi:hypothetical protein
VRSLSVCVCTRMHILGSVRNKLVCFEMFLVARNVG